MWECGDVICYQVTRGDFGGIFFIGVLYAALDPPRPALVAPSPPTPLMLLLHQNKR
jgi:hypothetical protein